MCEVDSEYKKWHFIKDCYPPEPEKKGGVYIVKNYLVAFKVHDDDYEVCTETYFGDGEFSGENEEYPIYAWYETPMNVPYPTDYEKNKENNNGK